MNPDHFPALAPEIPAGAAAIVLGGGCFWCIEAVFSRQAGVLAATSGYMGGTVRNPDYEAVCTGKTGHAEVVRVVFDEAVTSLGDLLEIFWQAHDPTTLNQQGGDVGTQYRSAIFYTREDQIAVIERSKEAAQVDFRAAIVTEIAPAPEFFPAEAYHQDYYLLNRDRNPYCRVVISPKLRKLGLEA